MEVSAPPVGQPSHGRLFYLPEFAYFWYGGDDLAKKGARETAKCVARWAHRYAAYGRLRNRAKREGLVPEDSRERAALLDEVFAWLESLNVPLVLTTLNLYRSDANLLAQHDGIPGVLSLTQEEFLQMQECLRARNLPDDLYCPVHEQQMVVEPMEKFGGVVRQRRWYTPHLWAMRDGPAIDARVVPSEEERIAAFRDACNRFGTELALRIAQLHEPGRERDGAELRKLSELVTALHRAHPVIDREDVLKGR
jgi:hypothetical protein